MQLESHVQAVCEDLASIAAVGDESTARAAALLAVALQSSLGRRFQEALAEAALELSSQLDDAHVEVRIAGGEPELVYVRDETTLVSGPEDGAGDSSYSARISLRLPESLKSRIDGAATARGVSVNTWLVQALQQVLEQRTATRGGHRLTGYGRS